jgi:predicted AlkP superfamily pyrophosphatase or phosphodiesterase
MLTDFAKSLIENEALGQDEHTDFLSISYSSTDYVGHNFGVNSKEIQDTYLRLDLNIAEFIQFLDDKVGENNYTLFLTSDHGAVHVPSYLMDNNIPSGYFDTKQLRRNIFQFVKDNFGDSKLIEGFSSNEILFDYDELNKEEVDADDLQEALYYHLLQYDKIDRVFTREMLEFTNATNAFESSVKLGFHPKRSGDILYILEPAVISYSKKGSTHGSYLNYDTQAPLLFYGNGIRKKESLQRYHIKDIAPTIAALLNIAQPNGTTGQIIIEALSN